MEPGQAQALSVYKPGDLGQYVYRLHTCHAVLLTLLKLQLLNHPKRAKTIRNMNAMMTDRLMPWSEIYPEFTALLAQKTVVRLLCGFLITPWLSGLESLN